MENILQIRQSSAFEKLSQTIQRIYGLQIYLLDNHFKILNESNSLLPKNEICKQLHQDEKYKVQCQNSILTQGAKIEKSALWSNWTCPFGMTAAIIPFYKNGDFQGGVYFDEFLLEENQSKQKNSINDYFQRKQIKINTQNENISKYLKLREKDLVVIFELVNLILNNLTEFSKIKINEKNTDEADKFMLDTKSSTMKMLYELVDKVSDSKLSIFINGESGTGKEHIANKLHKGSSRCLERFVTVNCGAISPNLMESEFFGHVKGAFTGAVSDKDGVFTAAHKGTLFLDEVADMPLELQVKLLRVLQDGSFTPVGGEKTQYSDVRIVTATNKNLENLVQEGLFREDLYYRLNVFSLNVPPLRKRQEDILALASFFLKQISQKQNRLEKIFSKDVEKILQQYNWPGNVRELKNEIERLIVLSGNEKTIDHSFVSKHIKDHVQSKSEIFDIKGKLKFEMDNIEKERIENSLKKHSGNRTKVAKELGINRTSLSSKIEKMGIIIDS